MTREELIDQVKKQQDLYRETRNELRRIEDLINAKKRLLQGQASQEESQYKYQLAMSALAGEEIAPTLPTVDDGIDIPRERATIAGLEDLARNVKVALGNYESEHHKAVYGLAKFDQAVAVEELDKAKEQYLNQLAKVINIGSDLLVGNFNISPELTQASLHSCELPMVASKHYSNGGTLIGYRERLHDLVQLQTRRLSVKYRDELKLLGIQLKVGG